MKRSSLFPLHSFLFFSVFYSHAFYPSLQSTTAVFARQSRAHLESVQKLVKADVASELPYLKNKFNNTKKGFKQCSHAYIQVDYVHIFGMKVAFRKQGTCAHISGFHLDQSHMVENSEALEFCNKKQYDQDFYGATLQYQGKTAKPKTTFFPAHWTREQVVEAIFEAYDDFIANDSRDISYQNGLYCIRGQTNHNITIEMVITKNGVMKTAYPIFS